MQLLFYSSGDDQSQKRLVAAVHKGLPERQIEFFKRLDDFRERLRMPIEPDSIAVLSVSNREELQQMQKLRGLLTEIYIVLVIPDRKKSTIELAHLLLPRFLSRKNDNFIDLSKVLNKMVRTSSPVSSVAIGAACTKTWGGGSSSAANRRFPSVGRKD